MRLGKTNLEVNKNGFGALPIQRCSMDEAVEILKKAYDEGINFYDTAHFYTDSEEKMGKAFEDIPRETLYLVSKTAAETPEVFWSDLKTSLESLKTDYLDLYQFHNISFVPKEDDDVYKAMLEAKEKGEEEIELVEKCKDLDVGFIAMKAMGGGLIKNSKASFAYINQFDNVLPIWGIQKLEELDEFLSYDDTTVLTDDLKAEIEKDKEELGENFCRGCAYCMPCPEEINISLCARMSLWIRRFPAEPYLTEEYQEMMEHTKDCTECYSCTDKCPYELDIPELLKENYEDYQNVLSGKIKGVRNETMH